MAHDLTHLINLKQLKALGTKVKGNLDTLFGRTTGLELHNAGSHNAIYRGKYLGTYVTAAQWAEIKAGTFRDLYIGDYWQKAITFEYPDYTNEDALTSKTMTVKMVIADFNTFYRYLNSNRSLISSHHITIIPEKNLYSAIWHNELDTNIGYGQSKIRNTYLTGANNAFKAFFGEEHLLEYATRMPTTADGFSVGDYGGYANLLNEIMLLGTNMHGAKTNWSMCRQLSLFKYNVSSRNTYEDYWLADTLDSNPNKAVYYYQYSHIAYKDKNTVSGIRPFCAIYQA